MLYSIPVRVFDKVVNKQCRECVVSVLMKDKKCLDGIVSHVDSWDRVCQAEIEIAN